MILGGSPLRMLLVIVCSRCSVLLEWLVDGATRTSTVWTSALLACSSNNWFCCFNSWERSYRIRDSATRLLTNSLRSDIFHTVVCKRTFLGRAAWEASSLRSIGNCFGNLPGPNYLRDVLNRNKNQVQEKKHQTSARMYARLALLKKFFIEFLTSSTPISMLARIHFR